MKAFVNEKGTEEVTRLCEQTADRLRLISALTLLEAHAALRRRRRAGDVSQSDLEDALTQLNDEMRRSTQMPVTQTLLQAAYEIVGNFQLRAPDAIQLASALSFMEEERGMPLIFVCSDVELLQAAREAGLQVLNPAV